MGCVIKYKGQSIPEEQFLQYLNKQIAINQLFETNSNLANAVYEALGFIVKTKIDTIKTPIEIRRELIEKQERGQLSLAGEDIDIISQSRSNPTEENIQKLKDLYNTLIGLLQDSIINEITPEQKQEAQQLYSRYLEQNPNGNIEGFKQWNNRRQELSNLFEFDPKLANAVYEALGFNFRYTSEKWKDDPTKENKATYINIKGTPSNQEVQIKKDLEDGFYSVHFKTEQGKLTKDQIQTLVDAVASQIPIGGKLSTWGEISKGGISGLNRFLNNGFKKVGEREIKDKEGRPVIIPILEKVEKSNLEQKAQQQYSEYLDTIFPDYINNFAYEAVEEFLVANKIIDRKC